MAIDTLELAQQLISRRSVTPDDAGCQDLIAARLRPLGFEIEVTGRPLPGWNVNFGYSQFKAEDRDDVPANTDQPRRLLKLFSRREVES